MLKSLEQFTANPLDGAYALAVELERELIFTFSYILDPNAHDFCPEFVTATYFSPEFLCLINNEQKAAIRRYLEGKVIVYRIFQD